MRSTLWLILVRGASSVKVRVYVCVCARVSLLHDAMRADPMVVVWTQLDRVCLDTHPGSSGY